MRIVLIANTLPPNDLSGVGEQVLQLASGLRDAGHEVEILGRGRGGARGPKILFPLTVAWPALRLVLRFRPHVVQVHESDGALAALAVSIVAGTLQPRPLLVALLQVSYLEEIRAVRHLKDGTETLGAPGRTEWVFRLTKGPLQVALGCLTAWLADLVLAPSARTAREIEHDYGVDAIGVLPNVSAGHALAEDRAGGAAPAIDTPYLLFVGRLRIRKAVEVMLHSLARAQARYPLMKILIVGDGEHRRALEVAALRLGLEEKAVFLGRREASEVRDLMSRARALVVPSIYEGMPLVVLEAMQASIPVVASSVSGIPEVVLDGETGYLVPAEDVGALEAALIQVWEDPDRAAAMGRRGRERLDENFRPSDGLRIWSHQVAARRPDFADEDRAIHTERGRES